MDRPALVKIYRRARARLPGEYDRWIGLVKKWDRSYTSQKARNLVDRLVTAISNRPRSILDKLFARVYHICATGKDVDFDEPFAAGAATEKPIHYLEPVPGCPETATTKYDVSQAMSFVGTHRNNAEERVTWQTIIPRLLGRLKTSR
jgi:hypothetical protein